jgi:hypothetical protein
MRVPSALSPLAERTLMWHSAASTLALQDVQADAAFGADVRTVLLDHGGGVISQRASPHYEHNNHGTRPCLRP